DQLEQLDQTRNRADLLGHEINTPNSECRKERCFCGEVAMHVSTVRKVRYKRVGAMTAKRHQHWRTFLKLGKMSKNKNKYLDEIQVAPTWVVVSGLRLWPLRRRG